MFGRVRVGDQSSGSSGAPRRAPPPSRNNLGTHFVAPQAQRGGTEKKGNDDDGKMQEKTARQAKAVLTNNQLPPLPPSQRPNPFAQPQPQYPQRGVNPFGNLGPAFNNPNEADPRIQPGIDAGAKPHYQGGPLPGRVQKNAPPGTKLPPWAQQ